MARAILRYTWSYWLLVAFALGCSQGPDAQEWHPTARKNSQLIEEEDCVNGSLNGKVGICHATGSPSNPYVHIRVSTNACIHGHAKHANDFISNDTSCRPTVPSCVGAHGTECNGESCCAYVVVPEGIFPMGRGTESCPTCIDGCPAGVICPETDRPEHSVTVSSFALDKYEVTLGRFRRFVESYDTLAPPAEGTGAHPLIPGSGWQNTWNSELPANSADLRQRLQCGSPEVWGESNESLPINCVGWYEAFAFCIWDGGRLPTEAEWEYATAGGGENRLYPWGSSPVPSCDRVNFEPCGSGPAPVGSLPAGSARWGHADLLGNLLEWVLDWYDPDFYSQPVATGSNVANLSVPPVVQRTLRGGSWGADINYLRSAYRHSGWITQPNSPGLGLRCARNP